MKIRTVTLTICALLSPFACAQVQTGPAVITGPFVIGTSGRSVSDSLSVADSAKATHFAKANLAETLHAVDGLTGMRVHGALLNETLSVADSVHGYSGSKGLFETLSIADSIAAAKVHLGAVNLSETLGASDSLAMSTLSSTNYSPLSYNDLSQNQDGNAPCANDGYAIDGNQSTSAICVGSDNPGAGQFTNDQVVYYGFPQFFGTPTSVTLYVHASSAVNANCSSYFLRMQYSLNGGTSWTNVPGMSGVFSEQTVGIPISTSQNLSQVEVQGLALCSAVSSGIGTATLRMFEIWASVIGGSGVLYSPTLNETLGIADSVTGGDLGQNVSSNMDLPLTDSSWQLPTGVDPMAYTEVGPPTHTVFISDSATNSCPKATAFTGVAGNQCGIYSGYVGQSGPLTLVVPMPTLHSSFTDLDTITGVSGSVGWASNGADGTSWDVWITHTSHWDQPSFSGAAWKWPVNCQPLANGACTTASGYLVFHSDCVRFSQYWNLSSAPSACPLWNQTNGTNDLGYLPRSRQATSHGGLDSIYTNPPLPNQGYRNRYGDGSVLGYPSPASPIPVTAAAYPANNCAAGSSARVPCIAAANPYNDASIMWTISSGSNGATGTEEGCPSGSSCYLGSIVRMADAHFDNTTNCYGGPCPNDGVSHIVALDVHFAQDPTGANSVLVDVTSAEWQLWPQNNPLMNAFVNAAPHDILISNYMITSDADEDGFSVNSTAAGMRIGCRNCAVTHGVFHGQTRNGAEGHGLVTAPPGPMLIDDNLIDVNSIGDWGGGGSVPPVCDDGVAAHSGLQCTKGMLSQKLEMPRNVFAYNSRWQNPPPGIAVINVKISSWTCSSGTLTLALAKTVGTAGAAQIYRPVVFVSSVSGVTSQWYLANNTAGVIGGGGDGKTVTIPSSGCGSGGTGTSHTILGGFTDVTINNSPIVVGDGSPDSASVALMNSITCGAGSTLQSPCDPTSNMQSVYKNPVEKKNGTIEWGDGNIIKYSGSEGQAGQCSSDSTRACSGVSKCGDGSSQQISYILTTNTLCMHANEGFEHDARSADGSWESWGTDSVHSQSTPTLAHVLCDPVYNNVVDFVYSANPPITAAEYAIAACKSSGSVTCSCVGGTGSGCTGGFYPHSMTSGQLAQEQFTGSDVFVFGVGSDLVSLLPDGWYQTENVNFSDTIPVILPTGETCSGTYSTTGNVAGKFNGNGNGVTPGMNHMRAQNIELVDLGNHQNWNGSGNVSAITHASGGHNYSINAKMGADSSYTSTAVSTPCGSLLSHPVQACVQVVNIDSCPGASYTFNPGSGIIPDCPRTLQALVGDLMNVICPSNAASNCSDFATSPPNPGGGDPGTLGNRMVTLDSNQTWFTYSPPTGGSGLACDHNACAGQTLFIPLEPPISGVDDYGSSGLYISNSYPRNMTYWHWTSVGMNAANIFGSSDESYVAFMDSIFAVPGSGDTGLPGLGTQTCGGSIGCGVRAGSGSGSDIYTGPTIGTNCAGSSTNTTGITNLSDAGSTMDFYGMAMVGRPLAYYPLMSYTKGVQGCAADQFYPFENSAPPRTSSPVNTLGPGGTTIASCHNQSDPTAHACDTFTYCQAHPTSCYHQPDSVGFAGSIGTNTYPLNLPDFRSYAVHSSSAYHAGNALQGSDGLDSGSLIPYLTNAFARTQRPALLTGYTYYHDGPQYEWVTWPVNGNTPYSIFEDGAQVMQTSNPYAQIYDLAPGNHAWMVKDSTGAALAIQAIKY